MADEAIKTLAVKIALEDGSFRDGMNSLKRQMQEADSGFKASVSGIKNWGNTFDGLKSNASALGEKISLQKQIVGQYEAALNKSKTALEQNSQKMMDNKSKLESAKQAYEESASSIGKNADETKKLKKEMDDAQADYDKSEKLVRNNNKAVEGYSIQLNDAKGKLKEMETSLDETNSKLKNHSVQWGNLQKALSGAGDAFKKAGEKLSNIGKSLTTKISLPLAAVGVGATKAAMDFDKSAQKVSTIADTSAVSMDKLKSGVLSLSNQTGESASNLNEALYQTISAGVKTGDAVNFLGTATKLAKGGFTDSQTAIDALTTTINAYGLKASDAKTISDQLIATQNYGKTTVAELGGAIGNVIPIAASMDVSTKDLFSSLAELTKNGVKTDEAVTGMKSALSSILKPSTEAAKAAKQMGIDFSEAHLKNVGWPKFLEEIKQKTGGSSEKMAELFGNVRALNAVTILAGKGSKDFSSILKQMGDTAGTTDSAFEKMENNSAAKWEKSLNKMKNAGIKLGESLAPVVTKISDAIAKIADKFNALTPAQQSMILKLGAIAIAMGPVITAISKLSTGIGGIFDALDRFSGAMKEKQGIAVAFTKMLTPAGAVILVLTAIAALAFVIIKNWGPISSFFKKLWAGIKSGATTALNTVKSVFTGALNGIKSVWGGITGFFSSIWTSIQSAATTAWNAISSAVMAIVTPFVAAIQGPFNTLKAGLSNIMSGIQSIFTGVWTVIKNVVLGIVLIFIDLITGDFTKLHSDLTGILNNIKNAFSTIWNGIKSVVVGIAQALVGALGMIFKGGATVLQSIGNGLKTFFTGLWNGIKSTAVNMFNSLLSFFSTLPSKFSGFMQGVSNAIIHGFDSAIKFIKSLPSQMLQWGKDMIQGLVDGIKSMADSVKDAVSGIGNTIRRHLHFSAPDEGPLADYETWMPDMMEGLANGINKNKYKVLDAMRSLASDMSINPQMRMAYAGGYSAASGTAESEAEKLSFVQNNYSPKALGNAETARQTRNLLRQARLQSRK